MRKSQITRFLSLALTLIVFMGLGFLYSHCAMQRLDRPAYGSGGNNNPSGHPGTGHAPSGQPSGRSPGNDSSPSDNTDTPKDKPDPRQPEEEWSDAHKKLRGKYRTWVNLDIVSINRVEEFLSGTSIDSGVDKVRAYFDLSQEATRNPDTYGGRIEILVELEQSDGDYITIDHPRFDSGSGEDNRYNVWSTFPHYKNYGRFHGFFENSHGSLIVVIDEVRKKSSDQQGEIFLGDGSIWFQKFKSRVGSNYNNCYEGGRYIGLGGPGLPNKPSKKCWFLREGPFGPTPFDCRAWKNGNGSSESLDTFRNLKPHGSPSDCYKELGDFENLYIKEAFNLEGDEEFLPGRSSDTRRTPVPPFIF